MHVAQVATLIEHKTGPPLLLHVPESSMLATHVVLVLVLVFRNMRICLKRCSVVIKAQAVHIIDCVNYNELEYLCSSHHIMCMCA